MARVESYTKTGITAAIAAAITAYDGVQDAALAAAITAAVNDEHTAMLAAVAANNAANASAISTAIAGISIPAAYTNTLANTFMGTRRMGQEIVETSPGVYPARYVYAGPVRWKGTVAPVATGSITSGTTAVAGLDYWRHLS